MKRGTTALTKTYRGTTLINKIYRGAVKLWESVIWSLTNGERFKTTSNFSNPTYTLDQLIQTMTALSYSVKPTKVKMKLRVINNDTFTSNRRWGFDIYTGGSWVTKLDITQSVGANSTYTYDATTTLPGTDEITNIRYWCYSKHAADTVECKLWEWYMPSPLTLTTTDAHSVVVNSGIYIGLNVYSTAGTVVLNPTLRMTGSCSNGQGETHDYRTMVGYGRKKSDATWVQLAYERHDNDITWGTDTFNFTVNVTDNVEYDQFRYTLDGMAQNTYALNCWVDQYYYK